MSIRAGASRKRLRKRWKVKESWRKSRVLGGKGGREGFPNEERACIQGVCR